MGITYTMQDDYLLPNLTLPEQNNREIGLWGQRHKRYLLNHHKVRYYNLLIYLMIVFDDIKILKVVLSMNRNYIAR